MLNELKKAGRSAYAGKPAGERSPGKKLPVPKPSRKQQAASAAPADGSDPGPLPDFLDRKKHDLGWDAPGAAEKLEKFNRSARKTLAATTQAAAAIKDYAAEHAARKKEKSRVRIEHLKAKKAGETQKWPETGKAAARVINAARREKKPQASAPRPQASAPKPEAKAAQGKTAMIANMLRRKRGVTRAEILEVTGWKAVSVQQAAKAAGLTLQEPPEKRDGVTVYRAA